MNWKVRVYITEVPDIECFVRQPSNVLSYIKDHFDYNERMIMLGLNVKNKILMKKCTAIGSFNTIMITPADILIPALVSGCRSIILVHNHPSSDTTPSQEDIIFTKKIEKASIIIGVQLLDHLIITDDDFYSFKENNLL